MATPNSSLFDGQLADFGFDSHFQKRPRNQQLWNKVERQRLYSFRITACVDPPFLPFGDRQGQVVLRLVIFILPLGHQGSPRIL